MSIKKDMDQINKQSNSLNILREKKRCDCNHKLPNGELDIVQSRNKVPGELNYVCRQCGKEINVKRIQEDELIAACNLIDRAVDLIKLSLSKENEKDAHIAKQISKVQYRTRNQIPDLYKASLKKSTQENNNRRRNRNGNNNSNWDRPTTR